MFFGDIRLKVFAPLFPRASVFFFFAVFPFISAHSGRGRASLRRGIQREGGRHGADKGPQVFILSGILPTRSTERDTPEILFYPGLPQREPGRESAGLAVESRKPGLLSRLRECCARAVMARGASGVLAATQRAARDAAGCPTGVTRCLPPATA